MAPASVRAGSDAEEVKQLLSSAGIGTSAAVLSAVPLERLQLSSQRHPIDSTTVTGLSCKQWPAATLPVAGSAAPAAASLPVPADDLPACRLSATESIICNSTVLQSEGLPVDAAAAAATAAVMPAAVPTTVPLEGLKLSSQEPLRSATRQKCPGCGKPRAFFCYDCLIPLMLGMPQLPNLPVAVHIVMHGETNAQATGTHAAVLAPQCVTLWRHQDGTSHHRRQPASKLQLPDWDPETTAVLFPASPDTPVVGRWGCLQQQQQRQQQQQGNAAVATASAASPRSCGCAPAEGLAERHLALLSSTCSSCSTPSGLFPYKAVVILEGNWAKAKTLLKHPKIAPLPCIQLPPHVRSLFWRRGTGSFRAAVDCGVCTIEALYLLCSQLRPEPIGHWDDLLWLWLYQRELVQRMGSYQTRQEMQQNFEAACGKKLGC